MSDVTWLRLGRHEVLLGEGDRVIGKVTGVARNADDHPVTAYIDVARGDNMKLIGEYFSMEAAKVAVEEALVHDKAGREAHGSAMREGDAEDTARILGER